MFKFFDRMNIWQGKFPTLNTAEDGYIKTAPVDAYGPQNDPWAEILKVKRQVPEKLPATRPELRFMKLKSGKSMILTEIGVSISMHLLIVHLFCLRHGACCVVSSYWGLGIVQHGGQRLGMDQRLVQPSAFFDRRESSYWLCGSNWSKHWRTWWAWVWAEKIVAFFFETFCFCLPQTSVE